MIGPERERGAALLTVLLLVAVMATVAAAALDRLGIGTRFVANSLTAVQARSWLGMAEQLTATRIEDALKQDLSQTLPGTWLDQERSIALPDGSSVRARVSDAGNCFNLNGLAQKLPDGRLSPRPAGVKQFAALMTSVGIGAGDSTLIATAAADYIGGPSSGRLIADPSELRLVANVDDRRYRLLEPWICALPMAEMAPMNVNTLRPDQAPLIAMLAPSAIDLARARGALTGRPADGFGSVMNFWQSPALAGVSVPPEAAEQLRVRTSFFRLRARVTSGDFELAETALFDARETKVKLINRSWGANS